MEKEWEPIEFREGTEGAEDERAFRDECGCPAFVAMCIRQHRKWRKSEGEYAYDGNPARYKMQPFCPRALTIVEDAAIRMLEGMGKSRRLPCDLTENERSWLGELLDEEIKNAEGGARNERLMGVGAPSAEAAGLNVENAEECLHYAGFLRELKGMYVEEDNGL